jgi:Domain of unknown function (DUF1902)
MSMNWRLGYPGWHIAAKFGIPIKIKVDVCHDDDAGVYYATSDDIGLAVEAASLDDLVIEIHAALSELLSIGFPPIERPKADIRLHDNLVAA